MKLSNLLPQIKTTQDSKLQAKKTPEATAPRTETAKNTESTDRVELSSSSLDMQKIKEILQETPTVRIDRVQALKAQIDRGEYQVDPYRVADKMLMDLLSEAPISTE